MKVVTVTPAGAIDVTYRIDTLRHGAFIRARSSLREISGKGVNVAVALQTAGADASAVVTLGSADESLARTPPYPDVLLPVFLPSQTRVNTQIVDAAGTTTKINSPSPSMTSPQWQQLVDRTAAAVAADPPADWLVLAGSVPDVDGATADIRSLAAGAEPGRTQVAVDTSGLPLSRLLEDPTGITLLTPNVHELSEALAGASLRTFGDVIAAARTIIARGVHAVYVSMGPDGGLTVTRDAAVHALAPVRHVASTAGAGDASLAGFLLGAGPVLGNAPAGLTAAAEAAARFGALAVSRQGTLLTSLDGLPAATVTLHPNPAQPLTEPEEST